MTHDLLTRIRAELGARLDELRPALDEYRELQVALDALGERASARERPAAPRVSTRPAATPRRAVTSPASTSPAVTSPAATSGAPAPGAATRAVASRAAARPSAAVTPRASAPRAATRRSARPTARPRSGAVRGPRHARRRAAIDAGGEAILAALEHGSHTVAELGVVTALPAGEIRERLRGLLAGGAIVKTERDGKTAYALPGAVAA